MNILMIGKGYATAFGMILVITADIMYALGYHDIAQLMDNIGRPLGTFGLIRKGVSGV